MVTFNHEEFIAKAIDSILMQKTNFDYEIVIGEDCSTDNTRDIIVNYYEMYPDKFRLLLNETNMGMHKNGAQAFQACNGKYVAMLEGDDYWTSPDKLQKQVDFLDNNSECAICFHNVTEVYKDSDRESHSVFNGNHKSFYTLDDLLIKNFIPTASTMFRNGLVPNIPDWFSLLPMGDWPLHILNALHGKIGYINEVMAVHLNHRGGAWSAMRQNGLEAQKATILLYDNLYIHLDAKFRRNIVRILHESCINIAKEYEDLGEFNQAKKYVTMSFSRNFMISKELFKVWLRLNVPLFYRIMKNIKEAACLIFM
jgi:glycosyltransferase involved in cell wall biosynthesis